LIRNNLLIGTLCLLVVAGSSNADRKRITLAPIPGIYTEADIKEEIIFGREMAAIILAEHPLSENKELSRYLNLVGQSILRQANRPEIDFYFAVIESPEVNAYAVPGGYIFITASAIEMMENEAELAGVLAHEIGHILDRHIVKALDIRADDESMTALVSKIVGGSTDSAIVVFDQAIDHAIDLLFSDGLKVEDEYSADEQGLFLAALAGYDPAASYHFLERVKQVVESKQGEMNSTHPPFSERINRLKKIIAQQGLSELGGVDNEKRFTRYSQTGG
jgi:predicted Zn-dependent protease